MRFTCRDGSEPALSAARQSLARQLDPVAAGSGIGVPNQSLPRKRGPSGSETRTHTNPGPARFTKTLPDGMRRKHRCF